MATFDLVAAAVANYHQRKVDQTISATETMNDQWYFKVGGSAMRAVVLAWQASNAENITSVLDVPSGHGRVLRHLVNLFPDASFDACDLDRDGIAFCERQFGARPILSKDNLADVEFDKTYDLIWVGSLFTHVSRPIANAWLQHLARFLSPTGFLVGTTHGRWSEFVHPYHPYIAPERWEKVVQGYRETGYGYCDYSRDENHSYIDGSYGISMARPSVTVSDIEEIPDTRLLVYRERGWGDHQDMFAIGKPGFKEPYPWMTAPT